MASIRKRGGKYQAQVRRQGFAPTVKTFHTKQDAQQWARLMETKADRGDMPVSVKELSAHKIADIIKRYRDEIVIKKRSCETETYMLNAFLKDPIANLTFAQITKARFVSYRDKRSKTVKAATVNRELGIISHAFNVAMNDWGLPIKQNPLAGLKKLKMDNSRDRRLEPREYIKILRATRHYTNKNITPIIQIALRTGMRRGEIINMRWEHVDLGKSILHIPVTKNGHPRDIPLCRCAVRLLKSLKPQSQGRVFPITANAFRLTWQRLLRRAGINDLHFHDLRHEAISRFFELGLSVPEVALISGHRDYRMLFRYGDQKRAAFICAGVDLKFDAKRTACEKLPNSLVRIIRWKRLDATKLDPKRLLNKEEVKLFYVIENHLKDKNERVMAQVCLGEFIKTSTKCNDNRCYKYKNFSCATCRQSDKAYSSFNSKRVDLLIIDSQGMPKIAIEYQGSGHYQGNAVQRDAVKKMCYKKAGIHFLEITHAFEIKDYQDMVTAIIDDLLVATAFKHTTLP